MEKMDAVVALAALAQDNRLDVFRLLVEAGPEGMPAGAVANALGLAPHTLTFHFDRLRDAGLVNARRKPVHRLRFANRRAAANAPRSQSKKNAMKRFHIHVAVDDLKQSIGF